jgi:hypothetical protein
MKYRIGLWAITGFLVAGAWALYLLTAHRALTSFDPAMVLIELTCPIALFRSYPIRLEWALLVNTATYAFAGLIVETLRQRLHPAR